MHRVAYDDTFLVNSLDTTAKADDFTKRLLDAHFTVEKIGFAQELSLGLFRSDYMAHDIGKGYEMRQVEVNTISSGFCGLGPRVTLLHQSVLRQAGLNHATVLQCCPPNDADLKMATGMIKAWDAYSKPGAVILFAVEDRTINIGDQRILEYALNSLRPDIRVIRKNFPQLVDSAQLGSNNELMIDSKEVAVVYFRYGYSPDHYPSEEFWNMRLKLEKSRAIKCPSIRYQLAGCKKIQQVIAKDDIYNKFIDKDTPGAKALKSTFAGMWGLELNQAGHEIVNTVLSNPEKFVMKPQREGGGNNIYASDIPSVLAPIKNSPEREAYIIMELIRQPILRNYILTPGRSLSENNFQTIPTLSELGIFGVILGDSNNIHVNYEASHVLRSKKQGVREGGIAAGFGAIDSPMLVSELITHSWL